MLIILTDFSFYLGFKSILHEMIFIRLALIPLIITICNFIFLSNICQVLFIKYL